MTRRTQLTRLARLERDATRLRPSDHVGAVVRLVRAMDATSADVGDDASYGRLEAELLARGPFEWAPWPHALALHLTRRHDADRSRLGLPERADRVAPVTADEWTAVASRQQAALAGAARLATMEADG